MMGGTEAALAEHAFEHLFIECLGWDRAQVTEQIHLPEIECDVTGIAHKRGFTVFVVETHRTVLANRQLLRKIQRRLRKSYHEHILISYCETPRKQVWQWANTLGDGRRVLHREHPFFSNEPPERLLTRIEGLEITFDEEESTSLPDVLSRVRTALLPEGEFNLFAKHPTYAAKSDQLAMAMKREEPGAFSVFVEFHMPLARHASKMLIRWFGMDPLDAEQTAMIGLIEAARRFDPERGFQFSTYAGYWIRSSCQRYGLKWGLRIRVPPHLFWPCFRLRYTRTELLATFGAHDAEPQFDEALAEAGITRQQWESFSTALNVNCLSTLPRPEIAELRVTEAAPVIDQACVNDVRNEIRKSLNYLSARQSEILRLRYGIDEREHTLQDVAERLGITRERVRQIQVKAEEKLQRLLQKKRLLDGPVAGDRQTEMEVLEEETT